MVCGDLPGFCPHNQGRGSYSLGVSTHRADSVNRGGFQPRKGSELWEGGEVVFFPFLPPPSLFSSCGYKGFILSLKKFAHRSDQDGVAATPEAGQEKVPEEEQEQEEEEEEVEEEAEEEGKDGEKGPVDYNALDYETMDGAGSDKDEDRFIKIGTSGTVVKKLESEIAPTGNGAVEEDIVTTAVVKETVQG